MTTTLMPKAEPAALPELPRAPARLEIDDGSDARPERPEALAAPDDPPGPLEPLAARPNPKADPEAAVPTAAAGPAAPEAAAPETKEPEAAAPEAAEPEEAEPPVDPDDSLEVWVAGPEGPDDPPGPVAEVLLDVGLEEAPPLVPPAALEPVIDPPVAPDDALPTALPVESPLDPPVEVPVAGPLSPLVVEVPFPDDVLPDELATAAAAGGGGVGDGPFFRAATNARLEISPVTGGQAR